MRYYRRESRLIILFLVILGLLIGFLVENYPVLLIVLIISLLITVPVFYYLWNRHRWETIQTLNAQVGITKETAYIDGRGYLRWKKNNRLCHRDIAWEHGLRGHDKFGNCDIHHKDENKFNNNPSNLEILTREEHQKEHKQVITVNGRKYYKLARVSKIYRKTSKAYLIARKWVPRSQTIIQDGYVYITEWIKRKKGF